MENKLNRVIDRYLNPDQDLVKYLMTNPTADEAAARLGISASQAQIIVDSWTGFWQAVIKVRGGANENQRYPLLCQV